MEKMFNFEIIGKSSTLVMRGNDKSKMEEAERLLESYEKEEAEERRESRMWGKSIDISDLFDNEGESLPGWKVGSLEYCCQTYDENGNLF